MPEALANEPKMSVPAKTIAQAYEACTQLARTHYENFPVGRLVPGEMQPHVHAVYAFARHADDLADEGYAGSAKAQGARDVMTPEERLAALDDWERQLRSAPGTAGLHFIFTALHETIRKLDLPMGLFTDLLSAFRQDVVKRRYANFTEVLDTAAAAQTRSGGSFCCCTAGGRSNCTCSRTRFAPGCSWRISGRTSGSTSRRTGFICRRMSR